jgi:hypothetical protein
MIKSRFMKVGTDNTSQFEPAYMSYLANLIVQNTPLSMKDADIFYIDKERNIQTQGV